MCLAAQRKRDQESTRMDSVSAAVSKGKEGDFSKFPELTHQTIENLKAKGINSLFPIQQHCMRPIYNKEDVIARDLTGSGKTLGFALPIVESLRK